MTATDLKRRQQRAETEALVVVKNEQQGGFLVYSAASPGKQYLVDGEPEAPTCTCPDFRSHSDDPDWKCKHILAAYGQGEEPPANKTNGNGWSPTPTDPIPGNILVRRSASPDGKIDSMTIEVTAAIGHLPPDQVIAGALRAVAIEEEIIGRHLGPRSTRQVPPANVAAAQSRLPTAPARSAAPPLTNGNSNGAIPAQLVAIGGMDGRWGRRLFIEVDAEAGRMRIFGTQKQLAEMLAEIGYGHLSGNVVEGAQLNVPCQVTTKPSTDGRYQNIDKVFPPAANAPARPSTGPTNGWRWQR